MTVFDQTTSKQLQQPDEFLPKHYLWFFIVSQIKPYRAESTLISIVLYVIKVKIKLQNMFKLATRDFRCLIRKYSG